MSKTTIPWGSPLKPIGALLGALKRSKEKQSIPNHDSAVCNYTGLLCSKTDNLSCRSLTQLIKARKIQQCWHSPPHHLMIF